MASGQVTQLLKKGFDAVWQDLERHYGLEVPKAFRDGLEADFASDFARDDVSEGELNECLRDFADLAGNRVRDTAQIIAANPLVFADAPIQAAPIRGQQEVKRIYEKPLVRRFQLLRFVTERVVPFTILAAHSFQHMQDGSASGQRASWKLLAAEWNYLNPHQRVSDEDLKHKYYDDLRKDSSLGAVYFHVFDVDHEAACTRALEYIQAMEGLGPLPDIDLESFGKSKAVQQSRLKLSQALKSIPQEVVAQAFRMWPYDLNRKAGRQDLMFDACLDLRVGKDPGVLRPMKLFARAFRPEHRRALRPARGRTGAIG